MEEEHLLITKFSGYDVQNQLQQTGERGVFMVEEPKEVVLSLPNEELHRRVDYVNDTTCEARFLGFPMID